MKRLIGAAKFGLMSTVLATIAPSAAVSEIYSEACIDESFVFTYVTPTIQTISIRKGNEGGKSRIIRGKIEMVSVRDQFIAGYLSTRYFKDDDLVDLKGEHDLEGFFIIDTEFGAVRSGLDGLSFFQSLDRTYAVAELDYLSSHEASKLGECR